MMIGKVKIKIDYTKYEADKCWDGLKGYVTNSKLSAVKVLESYNNLWQIEKAFRISKTDLRIRPIYHYLRRRIEAHLCIAFSAYAVYKELERLLYKAGAPISMSGAALLTHTMYQLSIRLPESKKQLDIILKIDEEQVLLIKIIDDNC